MIFYIAFYVANSITLWINSILSSKSSQKIVLGVILVLNIIFSGLRYNVGKDYMEYIRHFNNIKHYNDQPFELGANYLIEIIIYFGLPHSMFFLVCSIITTVGFYLFIKHFSSNISFSLYLFLFLGVFFFASFSLVRQFTSIAFMLTAIVNYNSKKYFTASLLIILSISFHKSAIIVLPAFLMFNSRLSIKILLIYTFSFFAFLTVADLLIELTKYGLYIERREILISNRNSVILIPFWLSSFFFAIFFYKKQLVDKEFRVLYSMNFISLLLVFSSFFSSLPNMFFIRVNSYFIASFLCLVPLTLNYIKPKQFSKIIGFIILIMTTLYFFYNLIKKGDIYNLVPYKLII